MTDFLQQSCPRRGRAPLWLAAALAVLYASGAQAQNISDGFCCVAPAAVDTASNADWHNPMALDAALGHTACTQIWALHMKGGG